ncbi:hypothetical protein TELCIR_02719 [Teladorsagia circumcincta]|uniref:Syndetin C-terminal domain-containing protein n=1 Tax=Teladorsagia circumcincta TaxID=45464 RepID=A0A2G9UYF2_TELCI|nr:hypothetical protein TELCIR_02719 [Teladorsagia circumcincta]
MEELRMFLENECFTICPVPHQFTIFDLQDFTFLEECRKRKDNVDVPTNSVNVEQHVFSIIPHDFVNPFGSSEFESQKQSARTSRSVEEPDESHEDGKQPVGNDEEEFVARQLDLVRPVMESLLPPANEETLLNLDQFYSKVLSVVPETRRLVYDSVASRVLKYPVLIAAVSNTKWDVNELQSRHSNYVDFMVKDFEGFALRLERATESINLSEAGRALLWDRTIYYAFKALVQGYCEGGKCSTEGRALMQLDFQHLLLKLEPICGLRPVPHTAFVEGYIKAFYLPENGLEEWISKHTEYTAKQMISLLSVATHVSKKARTRIINALND